MCVTDVDFTWIMYCIDFEAQEIYIHTSRPSRHGLAREINTQCHWMKNFFSWRFDKKNAMKFKNVWEEGLPKETNKSDYGIFMLRFIVSIMTGKAIKDIPKLVT
jgi:hypothetical protein